MDIKKNDILSRTSYIQVIDTGSSVRVKNTTGLTWGIENNILQNECKSANWFNKEEYISRTRICEILESTNGAVFSVTFNKQITRDDTTNYIKQYDKKELNIDQFTDAVSSGEERTLIGHLIDTKQEFGRYKVIDLEIQFNDCKAHALRQVDSKTISELIFNGVKYKVKK